MATTDIVDLPKDPEPEKYVVESIQAHHIRHGKNEDLVKWKGYVVNEMTWEPKENCNLVWWFLSYFLSYLNRYLNRHTRGGPPSLNRHGGVEGLIKRQEWCPLARNTSKAS